MVSVKSSPGRSGSRVQCTKQAREAGVVKDELDDGSYILHWADDMTAYVFADTVVAVSHRTEDALVEEVIEALVTADDVGLLSCAPEVSFSQSGNGVCINLDSAADAAGMDTGDSVSVRTYTEGILVFERSSGRGPVPLILNDILSGDE